MACGFGVDGFFQAAGSPKIVFFSPRPNPKAMVRACKTKIRYILHSGRTMLLFRWVGWVGICFSYNRAFDNLNFGHIHQLFLPNYFISLFSNFQFFDALRVLGCIKFVETSFQSDPCPLSHLPPRDPFPCQPSPDPNDNSLPFVSPLSFALLLPLSARFLTRLAPQSH